jgi:hypothetical protein
MRSTVNFKILSIACLPMLLAVTSCGSSNDTPATTTGGTCTHFDYSTWTPDTMARTLATDVMPIFTATCAIVACHAKGTGNPPTLGDLPPGMTVTADMVKANIVGVTSTEVASLKYVAAGDPQNSYLMRKLEDANPGCGLMCMSATMGGCTTRMPSGFDALMPAQLNIIRSWIKQGAN